MVAGSGGGKNAARSAFDFFPIVRVESANVLVQSKKSKARTMTFKLRVISLPNGKYPASMNKSVTSGSLFVEEDREAIRERCQEIVVQRVSFAHNFASTRELNMHLSHRPLGRINNSFGATIRIVPLCVISFINYGLRFEFFSFHAAARLERANPNARNKLIN